MSPQLNEACRQLRLSGLALSLEMLLTAAAIRFSYADTRYPCGMLELTRKLPPVAFFSI